MSPAADHSDSHDLEPTPLSPHERRAFATLIREHPANATLEDRIVAALHDAHLLGARALAAVSPRPARRGRAWQAFAALAASLVLFAAGIVVGRRSMQVEQAIAARQEMRAAAERAAADSMQLARLVQRAGSEYVSLLERLPTRAASDSATPRSVLMGREAARSTLHAAARQLARVSPNDPVAVLLVEGLRPSTSRAGQVLWF